MIKELTEKAPILGLKPIYYALLTRDLLSDLVAQCSLCFGETLAKIFDRRSIGFGFLPSLFAKF
jgi:hypothetical protein